MSDQNLQQRIADATAVFEKDVGVWDTDLEIQPAPGAPMIRHKGTMSARRIGGGRWLVADHRTEGGFEGHGVYGWDPATGKYTGVWVDSMGSGIARSLGDWDAVSRTMSFVTEVDHNGHVFRYREITETMADGSQVYHHLMPAPDGAEFEMIRCTYRKAG